MEVFTQFSSDLDDETKRQLVYGQGLMRLLRQRQYHPFSQHEQVVILIAALGHVMEQIPIDEIDDFRAQLLQFMQEQAGELCARIDGDKDEILKLAKQFRDSYLAGGKRGA